MSMLDAVETKEECIRHVDPKNPHDRLCCCACAGYGKVCPCAKIAAQHVAAEATATLYTESPQLFRTPPLFHTFAAQDLELGPELGSGGYCRVHKVKLLLRGNDNKENAESDTQYAIKFLKKQTMVDKQLYLEGAEDLTLEANYLAALSSEYIVKLHGIVTDARLAYKDQYEERQLFLVMDLLHDTLEDRLQEWNRAHDEHRGVWNVMTRLSDEFVEQRNAELQARLLIALQVARAMQYLHSQNVVYRDLKPANAGFTSSADASLKLFDFGVAKEMTPGESMTGAAGSLRYMAPEAALRKTYGPSVDVYSFGILLYEVASLNKPFRGYDANTHMQKVVIGGERPYACIPWFPPGLTKLIEDCWSQIASNRPNFEEVVKSLESIIEDATAAAAEEADEDEAEDRSWTKTANVLSYELFYSGSGQ